ncbi:MAG: arabinofuranosidase catalytic domain-containing protein, partial [Rhizomicrobium sp.]
METKKEFMRGSALALVLIGGTLVVSAQAAESNLKRPSATCDIYASAGTPCAAAHSTTRALYAAYNGPLYQILRTSDGKTLDIGVVQPSAQDGGGYADAAAQDRFCADTYCSISILYDQSDKHNDLKQPPRGGFDGPALGGFNNLPLADMAPVTVMGHKAYGVFIAPGMGLRLNDAKGTAVDDQAEGLYWVINGQHFNNGCCFDYGNGEIDSRDDGNGTMETLYFGNSSGWIHGVLPGPWIMTDQENNLVGCVNDDKSQLCPDLPAIKWRFATATAKGEPRHWAMTIGDAQNGPLKVTYDGKRVDGTYDPMRKQGAILLGNGGDNSNGSQGTFYEGAITAAGTYPSNAAEQAVQANIVAAGYDLPLVSLSPTGVEKTPTGLQTFSPGSSQKTTVTFTNVTGKPVSHVKFGISVPKGWNATVYGKNAKVLEIKETVAPGASIQTGFTITSGKTPFNGDIVANVSWLQGKDIRNATATEKVRNTSPIKINEFRVSDGSSNATNGYIELYNASNKTADISGWSVTEHAGGDAIFSSITLPAGTKLSPHGFYLLGLANSGLVVPAAARDTTIYVRSTDGIKVGDTITVGDGAQAETRKITSIGTAASGATTVWQPAETPELTIPAGSDTVPVTDVTGFHVGEKVALGYGAVYPVTGRDIEKYEVATVTQVGKAGTQGYLEANAAAGATNIQTTDIQNISAGDQIRLDIDSKGHGIETVTVKSVGTPALRSYVASDTRPDANEIEVGNARNWWGGPKLNYSVGGQLIVGTPGNMQTVTITKIEPKDKTVLLQFKPALSASHIRGEDIVELGSGIELTAPLRFSHAANLPFSARGTGIRFTPASQFAHSANEPVRALGTGITLDAPLTHNHLVDAVVRDAAVTSAGYQGTSKPNQWFGGPALSINSGSMVLRDAHNNVADSLNYGHYANNGNTVDPWAAEGYQAISGEGKSGCFVVTPGSPISFPPLTTIQGNVSAGRLPDGVDTDSNCNDFHVPATMQLLADTAVGAKNIKVSDTHGFHAGQTVILDDGAAQEIAKIAVVGSAGAAKTRLAIEAGKNTLPVSDNRSFNDGDEITIGQGTDYETAVIAKRSHGPDGEELILRTPLKVSHNVGTQISGTGITLEKPLGKPHAKTIMVISDMPT